MGVSNMTVCKTIAVDPALTRDSVRKVVEYTDTPLGLVSGRLVVRRVEKILMPNGKYRYPVTYIDRTPGVWRQDVLESSERKARELDQFVR